MSINRTETARCFAISLVVVTLAPGPCRADGDVDQARLNAADTEPQNWFTLGRDENQTYFSPLSMINEGNVDRLGFAWTYDLGTSRGQEATPIVVDGIMYTSGTWGFVYAVDAATGKEMWKFDPQADPRAARNPCCDLVNRGVAVWKGKVFVNSVDGVLHALDAKTGKQLWSTPTITDHTVSYSSTGAVYIAGNVAVIGNSGSDMDHGAVRGYVSAYDVDTGALKWRVYTVPARPEAASKHPELATAEKTWSPLRDPMYKGGGTVWDGFAYDPTLNLVYFGTANAAPYDLRQLGPGHGRRPVSLQRSLRSTPDTGRMAWYLSDDPGRPLGLRFGAEADPRRPQYRRAKAPGHHASEQERLLLCARPRDREARLRARTTLTSIGPRASI